MANTGKKNFTGVPFGSNLYMVNPRYHNNFSTITYNGSTYPIKNILNLDKGNNAIEVEYDYDGSPMKEWITPSEDFWATNIPTDNQASIQQTGYNGLDTLDKRAQMMATRGIGTGTFTGGELQPMTNYRSSIWDYKAPSIKGPAEDIDKVMLGTLGLGIAPVAIPEVATALSTISIPFEQTIANTLANPYVQAGLTSAFAAGAAQEMPNTLQNTSAAREEFMQHPSWYTGLNYAGELGKLGLDASMFASPTKALVTGSKELVNGVRGLYNDIWDNLPVAINKGTHRLKQGAYDFARKYVPYVDDYHRAARKELYTLARDRAQAELDDIVAPIEKQFNEEIAVPEEELAAATEKHFKDAVSTSALDPFGGIFNSKKFHLLTDSNGVPYTIDGYMPEGVNTGNYSWGNYQTRNVEEGVLGARPIEGNRVNFRIIPKQDYVEITPIMLTDRTLNIPTINVGGTETSIPNGWSKWYKKGLPEYTVEKVPQEDYITIENSKDDNFESLSKLMKTNHSVVQEEMPGFVPSGSSWGVQQGALRTIPKDIDGFITKAQFEQYRQGNPNIKIRPKNNKTDHYTGETNTFEVDLKPEFGEQGTVDVNIVDINSEGIGNKYAMQIYQQFFPAEYQNAVKRISTNPSLLPKGKTIKDHLPIVDMDGNILTAEQLMERYDPDTAVIINSMTADFTNPVKGKHNYRFFEYLAGDRPDMVHKALQQYADMLTGGKGRLLPELEFGSVEENRKLLDAIGYKGPRKGVADDAAKMQNIMDCWYLTEGGVFGRAAQPGDAHKSFGTIETLYRNFSKWLFTGEGGTASGFGQNWVAGSSSGAQRDLLGFLQPEIKGLHNGMNAKDAVTTVQRAMLHPKYKFTQEDVDVINRIYKEHNINCTVNVGETGQDLIAKAPSKGKNIYEANKEIAAELGINFATGQPYGFHRKAPFYTGSMRDFNYTNPNGAQDVLGITRFDGIGGFTPSNSWNDRMGALSFEGVGTLKNGETFDPYDYRWYTTYPDNIEGAYKNVRSNIQKQREAIDSSLSRINLSKTHMYQYNPYGESSIPSKFKFAHGDSDAFMGNLGKGAVLTGIFGGLPAWLGYQLYDEYYGDTSKAYRYLNSSEAKWLNDYVEKPLREEQGKHSEETLEEYYKRRDAAMEWVKQNVINNTPKSRALGGPLIQMANRYEIRGPKRKRKNTIKPTGLTPWPALSNIEYQAIADPTFTRDKTGEGSIEYFAPNEKGIQYNNGYYREHPMFGHNVILYNPDTNDEQDIRLDALHAMPQDPTYDVLNTVYRNRVQDSDVAYNALRRYKEAEDILEKQGQLGKDVNPDPYPFFLNNEADGLLRNLLIEGTPEYMDSKRYYPDKQQLREWNAPLVPYVDAIQQYLETNERPQNVLEEVVVEGNKHSEGGSLNTHKKWEDLSMKERGEMIRVAIRNGITNLSDIKSKYNEFAEGGNLYAKGNSLKKATLSPNVQYAMRYFINKGLAPHQAAGLVGNLMRESSSNLNIGARNPNGGAFGIAQWLGARQKNLFAKYGRTPSLQQQLDYVWHELNTTHKNGLRSLLASRDAAEAARNAFGWYEFSVGPEGAVADMNRHNQNGTWALNKGVQFASQLMGQPVPQIVNLPQQQMSQAPMNYAYEQPQGVIIPPLTPYNQEAFYNQDNTSNNQALIDMMNSIQDQYNAYQEDVRRKELAQQEAAIKQQRMQGLSTLLSMFGSMNQDEGTSPFNYMASMLTMMPNA